MELLQDFICAFYPSPTLLMFLICIRSKLLSDEWMSVEFNNVSILLIWIWCFFLFFLFLPLFFGGGSFCLFVETEDYSICVRNLVKIVR